MKENLMCSGHKATTGESRRGYDRIRWDGIRSRYYTRDVMSTRIDGKDLGHGVGGVDGGTARGVDIKG